MINLDVESVQLDGSNTLRKVLANKIFTDLTIKVADKLFTGNKCIITMVMPIFNQFLNSSSNIVDLGDSLDPVTFESALDYFYGKPLPIDLDRVDKLLEIGKFLQSTTIVCQCEQYLTQTLSLNNLFFIHQLADKFDLKKLQGDIFQLMASNYTVITEQTDFLKLSLNQFSQLISRQDLIVNCESSIFDSIMNWISHDSNKRKIHLYDLLSNLRFHLIANNEITNHMLTNRLLRDGDSVCIASSTPTNNTSDLVKNGSNVQKFEWPPDQNECILIFGGNGPINPGNSYKLNIKLNCWEKCAFKVPGSMSSAIFIAPNSVYFFQSDSNGKDQLTEKFFQLNLSNGSIVPLASSSYERIGQAMVCRDSQIYIVGGKNWLGLFEKLTLAYDLNSNTWSLFKSLNSKRAFLSIVNLNGRLFAIGGLTEDNKCLNTVEVNDTLQSEWYYVASMKSNRFGHSSIILNKCIYVVGGCDESNTLLNTIEKYNPELDTWSRLPPMKCPRYQPFLSNVGDKLYVIGGLIKRTNQIIGRSDFFSPNVEVFDSSTDSWSCGPSLPDTRSNGIAVSFY